MSANIDRLSINLFIFRFNYLSDSDRPSGSSTEGIFTYFFWVLLQVTMMSKVGQSQSTKLRENAGKSLDLI